MINDPKPNEIEDWVCIMERGTELEIASAKNYLANMDIPANMLSKRDSSYNVNIGDMALVYLYVPKEYEEEAREALQEIESEDEQKGREE